MRIKKFVILSLLIPVVIFIQGCSESNPVVSNPEKLELIYERQGLVDSLTGTCSAYLIRNHILQSLNLESQSNVRICFDASTDGDLSNIEFFVLDNSNQNILLYDVEGLQINDVSHFDVTIPGEMVNNIHLRLRLFSSVCTGHIYHLRISNLQIYKIN